MAEEIDPEKCNFGVTVCKTVCPMLLDRCPVCLSVLSVTLVYCGQTVGRMKMKLGMQVGLGRGHIVLSGAAPNFWPMSIVAKRLPISAAAELLLELRKHSDLDLDLGSGRGHTGAHTWSRSTG